MGASTNSHSNTLPQDNKYANVQNYQVDFIKKQQMSLAVKVDVVKEEAWAAEAANKAHR